MDEYLVSNKNPQASSGISYFLEKYFQNSLPVIVCVGTDSVVGDSLGPMVGTILKERKIPCFIYGCLNKPITAKEVNYISEFLPKAHPYSKFLIIDAAVGQKEDVGMIKLFENGINPGLGANKVLPKIGDYSIIAIVAEKGENNQPFFHYSRIGDVFSLAKTISNGICDFLEKQAKRNNAV